jgi:hypothetical protein
MSLFVYVWLKTRDRQDFGRFVWLGLLAGLASLVRWQDAIVLILPGLELTWLLAKRRITLAAGIPRGLVVFAGVALMLMPQLLAWRSIYGEFLVMPQGESFMRWTAPEVGAVLFSLRHGLFSWTPAVLVAVIGFALLVRRDALLGSATILLLIVAIYINAAVSDWWAGAAFGARRFIGYTVFFALGFAAIFWHDAWRQRAGLWRAVAAGLVVYNLLFVLQYQTFMRGFVELAPYPATAKQVLFDRLLLPFQLVRAWLARS